MDGARIIWLLLAAHAATAVAAPTSRPASRPVSSTVAPDAAPTLPEPPCITAQAHHPLDGLLFGSYGRVGFSGDLRAGSRAKSLNVVMRGPRLEEPTYGEINLGYRLRSRSKMAFTFLFTLGLLEQLFHYDGDFESKLAIRNLYLQVDNVVWRGLSLWAGSRMLRGDDIYLLDFWPLDDLNTLGGGAMLRMGATSMALNVGVTRLDDPYQYQRFDVVGARVGAEEIEILDRQRMVLAARVEQRLALTRSLSMKLIGYGELHLLPSGSRRDELVSEVLPRDFGWVAGVQVGAWRAGTHDYANLFFRAGGGLGAFDELEVPTGLDDDKQTTDANELRVGSSGYLGWRSFGVLAGGYLRYFRDADGVASDYDDGWEYVLALRPMLFFTRHLHQLFELSVQGRRPDGLHPEAQEHLVPHVYKLSLMPALSWDSGPYARPQLRVVYTLSYLDEAARSLFAPEDPRRGRALHHYLGVQAEWWYKSSYR